MSTTMERTGPDRETLRRAADGDGAAFRTVVDAWKDRVFAFCYRMTGDRALTEDLSQEVFLHLFHVLRRYDDGRPFPPWMRRVMTNVVLNRLRGERAPALSLDLRPEGASLPADPRTRDPGATAAQIEEAALVRRCVRELPPGWRAVVALRYTEDLPVQSIAEALDLPVNTVKTRLFRAREALRVSLAGPVAARVGTRGGPGGRP